MNFSPEKFSISALVDAWNNGSLARNPEYQRGEAWSVVQKQALIDSIFRNYPIPPLFLEKKTTKGLSRKEVEKHEVVDGQQRILALAAFMRDEFELLAPDNKKLRLPISMRGTPVRWEKRRYSHLEPELQKQFKDKEIDAYEISDVTSPDEIRDLFIRLQSGTALTRQQIRDAWPGNLGPYIESLAGKLQKQPRYELFQYVDGRGTRDEESDPKDRYVKHRQTCAQVLRLLLESVNGTTSLPSVSASDLDALYHEHTAINIEGETISRVNQIFANVNKVCKQIGDNYTKKYKFPKQGLFALALYFRDVLCNPLYKLDSRSIDELAEYIRKSAPKPSGRSTSGHDILGYYESWRASLPKNIGITLDTKRTFDESQKAILFEKTGGKCAICNESVLLADAEYDHYPIPYRDGGKAEVNNGRLVHKSCHPRGRPPITD